MEFLILGVGCFFAFFSTIVLSYISMTTMVGPWIAPTLVLLGHTLFSFMRGSGKSKEQSIASMQAIGSVGGILATGVGFALPMLYFLDAPTFNTWLASPAYFCGILFLLCMSAGGLGLIIGHLLSKKLIDEQKSPFPVSQLTYQVITSQTHPKQARQMIGGIFGTMLICTLRDGIWKLSSVISKTYYLFPSFLGKEAGLAIWPSLWAIGFSVGLSVTVPLFIGLISKYLVVYPLAHHATYLPFNLFPVLSGETFTIAFCSGMVLCELVLGLKGYAKKGWKWAKKKLKGLNEEDQERSVQKESKSIFSLFGQINTLSRFRMLELTLVTLGIVGLLFHFKFTFFAQTLLILFTLIATYSICQIGAEIGMLPFGRYSTFIVIPLLLLFKLDPVQATITCVFFDICAATASDLLFDYKTGELCAIDKKKMYFYQWIGLLATSLFIGVTLWLLFTHLQLGSEALFAQRGKTKALLLQSLHFDAYIVGLGLLFGLILKRFKLNITMVFGGLLMPNSITIGLMLGSLSTLLVKDTAKLQPLCAGILAAESLWVMLSILVSML